MKRNKIILGSTAALIATLLLFSTAEATMLLKVDLSELINRADVIVIGKAQGSVCLSDIDGSIYTNTNFLVTQIIKGNNVENIVVKTPGGTVGSKTIEVMGAPSLTNDGEYVLFLYADPNDYMSNIVGWTQGLFTIENGTIRENSKTVIGFVSEITTILNSGQ